MNKKFRFKISHKLAIVLAIFLAGFAVVGIEYAIVVNAGVKSEQEISKLEQFGDAIELIHRDLLVSLRIERDFIYSKDINLVSQFEIKMTEARENLATLQSLAPAGMDLNLVNTLQELFRHYHGDFYTMAEAHVQLGLGPDKGVRGELREAIESIEADLSGLNSFALSQSLLAMRSHTVEYLTTDNKAFLDMRQQEQDKLIKNLRFIDLSTKQKDRVKFDLAKYDKQLEAYTEQSTKAKVAEETIDNRTKQIQPLFGSLVQAKNELLKSNRSNVEKKLERLTYTFGATVLTLALAMGAALFWFARDFTRSLGLLQNAVSGVTAGDYSARANSTSSDELGELGRAFDNLLDERVANLAKAEAENERLNESIIAIMGAVDRLSRNDLTVEVPVKEDITGAVADAINLMSSEAASVLAVVQEAAIELQKSAEVVRDHGDTVSQVATTERELVEIIMDSLGNASKTMKGIAVLAKKSNEIADGASNTTQMAFDSVHSTAAGMKSIRDTVNETGKRIKRLGERSQEITEIVNVIKDIADKTDGLAINASMQAAAAGEAGRGFAVVAEQVQRLAQNASESSAMITSLVKTIQSETAEAMAVTNRAIDQVVTGSQLADQSGKEMKDAQDKTGKLVAAVENIARYSIAQAKNSDDLYRQAERIQISTQETGKAIDKQAGQTRKLAEYAKTMLDAISVFKLPQKSQKSAEAIPLFSERESKKAG